MRMSRRTSGICDGISAARDQDTPSGVIGCRGHLATTFGRLQFAGAPMPYRVGSRWSSQRQEGRVFRFLPPFPSGEGSSTRGSSEFRVGRCERQLGTPSGVRGAIRRQRAFGRGVDGEQVDMGRGHQRRASGGYIPWRGQTPREHRLSMDLNPPWRVSNAMVDESLEDGELASRPSTFGRFLLFFEGRRPSLGGEWIGSRRPLPIDICVPKVASTRRVRRRRVMSACHIDSHANQGRSTLLVSSLRG